MICVGCYKMTLFNRDLAGAPQREVARVFNICKYTIRKLSAHFCLYGGFEGPCVKQYYIDIIKYYIEQVVVRLIHSATGRRMYSDVRKC